jgi:hypothetical protein
MDALGGDPPEDDGRPRIEGLDRIVDVDEDRPEELRVDARPVPRDADVLFVPDLAVADGICP